MTARANGIVAERIEIVIAHLQTMQSKNQTGKIYICFGHSCVCVRVLGLGLCFVSYPFAKRTNADKFSPPHEKMKKVFVRKLHSLSQRMKVSQQKSLLLLYSCGMLHTFLSIYLVCTLTIDNDDKISILRQTRKNV